MQSRPRARYRDIGAGVAREWSQARSAYWFEQRSEPWLARRINPTRGESSDSSSIASVRAALSIT